MTAEDILFPYTTAENLRDLLRDLIAKQAAAEPRSLQKAIGASEIGIPCDRQLAYRITGTAPSGRSTSDPLPSVIGTAVHALLHRYAEQANLIARQEVPPYMMEMEVEPARGIKGHADLYISESETVVDWKVLGNTSIRALKQNGPHEQYRTQVHLYAKGFILQGFPVENVAIAALPRSGFLRDLYVWTEPYSEALADNAIQRFRTIIELCDELQVENNPKLFWAFATHPGKCEWCPFFSPNASTPGTTCPGDFSHERS